MFPRMLMKLVSLRTLSSVHSEQVFALRLQDKKLPPLLSEIWDVNEWLPQKLPFGPLDAHADTQVFSRISLLPRGWDFGRGIEIFFIFYVRREEGNAAVCSQRDWFHFKEKKNEHVFAEHFVMFSFFQYFVDCHDLSGVEIPTSGS